jgi:hypothetical protein
MKRDFRFRVIVPDDAMTRQSLRVLPILERGAAIKSLLPAAQLERQFTRVAEHAAPAVPLGQRD